MDITNLDYSSGGRYLAGRLIALPLLRRVSCLAGTDAAGEGGGVSALTAGGDAVRTWSLAGVLSRAALSRALNGVLTLGLV